MQFTFSIEMNQDSLLDECFTIFGCMRVCVAFSA